MKNNSLNKTLKAKTGKDIFKLMGSKDKGPKELNSAPPTSETEIALFAMWHGVLGHEGFSINDDFFHVGGNSLKAVQLVSRVTKELSVQIQLTDIFLHPTIAALAVFVDGQVKLNGNAPVGIVRVQPRPEKIPFSFGQERLWFIDKLEGSIAYHIPTALRLNGNLNIDALKNALQTIVERHETLRTVYQQEDGQARQVIQQADNWQLDLFDGLQYQNDKDGLHQFVQQLINKPFDLSKDYMLRAELIKLGAQEHLLVVTMHHISSDGWSMPIIVREVIELYQAFSEGRKGQLSTPEIQYADYAIWQRNFLQGEVLETKLNYWKEKLTGVAPLQLPTDHQRPAVQTNNGSSKVVSIDKELTDQLNLLSQANNATLFMTLLSAFKILLYRYTNQGDICVGTPVANRTQQEVEAMVGFFVNTLAVRSEVDGNTSFIDLLADVKSTTIKAYQHQDVPFEKVVEAVVKERDISRSPLFQVMFALQNTPEVPSMKLQELELSEERLEQKTSMFDISLSLTEGNDGLHGELEYNTDLYNEDTIERFIGHYKLLLSSIVIAPDQRIVELQMLPQDEEKQLLLDFNNSGREQLENKNIVELFEAQVVKAPESTALVFENETLSYRVLNERANQLAHLLRTRGVGQDTLIPICIDRSLEMVIGIIAILKAGAAYVPIDPEYPEERIKFMVEDSAATVVVSSKARGAIFKTFGIEVIEIDSHSGEISKHSTENLNLEINRNAAAYIIYTSGTTGFPKGVIIEHGMLSNYVVFFSKYFSISREDTVFQLTSISFDVMVEELYPALINGGQILIIPEGGRDIDKLKRLIEEEKITIITTTPLVVDWLNKTLSSTGKLRHVITGGDVLYPAQINNLFGKVNIANGYGPSEATVAASFNTIKDLSQASLIGKPIENVSFYITGKENELLPIGAIGELCIGGANLSRGYLNMPDLTADRFIKDPFSTKEGARLYKTGDLGRWLPDGNLEYLGRLDEQVKIRGYRIELGEIESVLLKSGLAKQAVVIAKESAAGGKQLIGYVVPQGGFDKQAIIAYLSNALPEYMVPAVWLELESIPLTPNGKVDKKALPAPDSSELVDKYVAPKTDLELKLTEIWQDLLGVERVGVEDNFFELGGDSILTIQVVSRANRQGYSIQPRDIFLHQTIARLSKAVAERTATEVTAEQGVLTGTSGLLPIQQWYLDQEPTEVSHYNQSILLSVDKSVTPEVLNKAIEELSLHHDALRFKYYKQDGEWMQEYTTHTSKLITEDLQSLTGSIDQLIAQHADKHQRGLDIERGDVMRVVLMQTPQTETENKLLVVIHHLPVDGVSWRILLEDFELLITNITKGEKTDLGRKTTSYRQWYNELEQYGQTKKLQSQKRYWEKVAESYQPIPVDIDDASNATVKDLVQHTITLSAEQTQRLLQEVPKVYHTEINDLLLSALGKTISTYANSDKVTIGLEGHGREHLAEGIDTSRTIGWFTNLYPVLLNVDAEDNDALIKTVKEQLRQVPTKGLGWGVLKYINREASLQGKEPWDVVFNYLGQFDSATNKSAILRGSVNSAEASRSTQQEVSEKLLLDSYVQSGELVINFSYSSKHFHAETITSLADDYISNLQSIIDHCSQQQRIEGTVSTPSDFNFSKDITYQELDQFLNEPFKDGKRKDQVESIYKLSGLQQGMLFHGLYDDEVGAYTEQFSCDLLGADVEVIKNSWQSVMKKHTILRSAFYHNVFSVPVQCVYKEIELPITELDFTGAEQQDAAIKDFESTDLKKGFDFQAPPLMRVTLLKLGADRWRMVWTSHHILFDGWSLPILIEELLGNYQTLLSGKRIEDNEEDRYEDFIKYTEQKDKEHEERYWQDYLKGVEQSTLLPFIAASTERTKGVGEYSSLSLPLDRAATSKVQSFAQKHRLTINTVMQGVWSCLLHRYTGNSDVIFGFIVSGRPNDLQNVERRVGMYINTLPFRSTLDEGQSIVKWLQRLQDEQVASRQYQNTPLTVIQKGTAVQGDLFDSLMVFENYPVSELIASKQWGLGVENVQLHEQTNYPLSLIIQGVQELNIKFSYNQELLDRTYVNEIRDQFENVLFQIINEPGSVNELRLLTAHQEHKLLHAFNNTTATYPIDKTIVDLFESQVAKTPDATAVIFEEQQLTYAELNEQSNQLAHYLRAKGVQQETLVPICIERRLEMIVGILAILKAGGVYVPIDPEYPQDRIQYMLEDTGAKVVVSSTKAKAKLPPGIEVIDIDGDHKINEQPTTNLQVEIRPNNLAYIIYTSGSTGKPKGAMIEHRNVVRLFETDQKLFHFNEGDVWTLFHSFAFDFSVWEMYGGLLYGGRVVIVPSHVTKDVALFSELLVREKVTILNQTPSAFYVLQDYMVDRVKEVAIRYVIFGGEALNPSKLQPWKQAYTNSSLINMYGITETTVHVTYQEIGWQQIQGTGSIIGKPIPTLTAYILDEQRQLLPIGIAGELYIGGAGLSRGYLNRPDLTADRFIKDPFSNEEGARLYKTGDLGRWLPDGNIEYLGRIDDQVKIRGFRIELGEIESVLLQSGLVKQAVVLAKENAGGNKQLVGYIVPEGAFDKAAVIASISSKLPDYMVPALWVELQSIPLTSNGKVDKKALPSPDSSELLTNKYVAPQTEFELKLAEIWQDLLGVERVGIEDNFFELGGNSILTIQVVSRANRQGYSIQPKDIFLHQTIARLSKAVAERTATEVTAEQGILTGTSGLLPIQQWYLEKEPIEVSHNNQSILLSIDKSVTPEVLSRAVTELSLHHDALRFKYYKEGNEWKQEYTTHTPQLIIEDLQLATGSIAEVITQHANKHQRSLDIAQGDVMGVVLMQTPQTETRNRLLFVIHHLAVDGVSWRILLEDLELLITNIAKGEKTDLGTKTSSYRQWYNELEQYGQTKKLQSQKGYWQNVAESYKPIRVDIENISKATVKDIAQHTISLSAPQTQQLLQEVPGVYHTEINDILLSALAKSILAYVEPDQVTIGFEGHGREHIGEGIDTSRTVGWFTNLYPVLLKIDAEDNDALIKTVKEQIRQVPGKGLGWGVLKYINKEEALQGKEPWDIVFNYLGRFDNVVSKSKWLAGAEEGTGASRSEALELSEKISIDSHIQSGELVVNFSYSTKHFYKETITTLAERYIADLQTIIAHCIEQQKTEVAVYTPSDHGLAEEVTYKELDNFLNEPFKEGKRKDQVESIYKLSGLQQGMLFHGLYDEEAGAYTEQFTCDLINPNIDALSKSWQCVLAKHSILRSAFYHNAFSIPVQAVYREIELPIEVIDFTNLDEEQQAAAIKEFEASDIKRGFDFQSPPLMRVALLRLSADRYKMIWTSHHILFDGWSLPILMEELLTNYDQLISGNQVNIGEEERYEDFIKYTEQKDKEQEENYWKDYLKGVEQSTLLPFIAATTERTKGVGEYKSVLLEVDTDITSRVQAFAQKHRVTLNTVMQGIWSILLHHYCNNDDVVFGTIASGRPDNLPDVEQRVGMYINTLPLRSNFNSKKDVGQWLQGLQDEQVASRHYQNTALRDIQRESEVQGDLFDSLMVFENYPISEVIGTKQWSLQVENVHLHEQTNYPLTIIIQDEGQLIVNFSYNEKLLDEVYVAKIKGHFEKVLLQLIGGASALSDIKILTQSEEEQLLIDFNNTQAEYPKDKTLVDLFEEQAERTPNATAVVFEEQHLSYAKLNEQSNQLAHYLQAKGVKQETLVPICIERSLEMIVGILGILKAGGAYVPIDPEYPEERIQYMLEDTTAPIVLTSKSSRTKLPPTSTAEVIEIDGDEAISQLTNNLDVNITPNNLAYVIYTSGSTGKPKGAMNEHGGIVNRLLWAQDYYNLTPQDTVLQKTTISFDVSVWELIWPLLVGSKLVFAKPGGQKDNAYIKEIIDQQQITMLHFVPSMLGVFLPDIEAGECTSLKKVLCSGEALKPSQVNLFKEKLPHAELHNLYGPTEAAIDVTYWSLKDQQEVAIVPIGKPVTNTQIYILDKQGQPVPVGIGGEIYIGGVQVGRGYLNRPELTAEKFVQDPFSKEPGRRLYKTGDLGRWLPDVNIEYLGRIDDQVKIRGFRIELGEIESVLQQSGLVKQAVVIAKENAEATNS